MSKMINLLAAGARTVGGLKRAGVKNPLKIAVENPNLFSITPSAASPVISLRR